MTEDLLLALGEADANRYLCSKEVRPGEKFSSLFSLFFHSWSSFFILGFFISH